jgi:hypothetical protein
MIIVILLAFLRQISTEESWLDIFKKFDFLTKNGSISQLDSETAFDYFTF